MKFFYPLVLLLAFFSATAQTKSQRYSAEVYTLNSKSHLGFITEANDSTLTLRHFKKIRTFHYSELKTIKFYKQKSFPLYFYPTFVGFGYILSSPFKSDLKSGLRTAGIGAGIVIMAAVLDFAFKKAVEKINVTGNQTIKTDLEKYVLPPPVIITR